MAPHTLHLQCERKQIGKGTRESKAEISYIKIYEAVAAAAADLFWGIKKPTKQTKDETSLPRVSFRV